MLIQPKWVVYGILFMFAVILFVTGIEWMDGSGNGIGIGIGIGSSGKEGLTPAPSSAPPTPIETSDQPSTSKSGSKLSACGDGCDSYATIQATLDSFNKLNKKNDESAAAIQKVDMDIIKLSKSAENMGKQKVPGGKPVLPKKM